MAWHSEILFTLVLMETGCTDWIQDRSHLFNHMQNKAKDWKMPMKHFFNRRENIVTEALDGLLLTSRPGMLARLDSYPQIKVILRADWDKSRVAVTIGRRSWPRAFPCRLCRKRHAHGRRFGRNFCLAQC